MKKARHTSLAVKLNIQIILVILAVFAILHLIGISFYRSTVIKPYEEKLKSAELPTDILRPYLEQLQEYLGTDGLKAARAADASGGEQLFTWMGSQVVTPPEGSGMTADSLLEVLIAASLYVDTTRNETGLDVIHAEAVKGRTVWQVFSSARGITETIYAFAEEFGREEPYFDLRAGDYASPVLHSDGQEYTYLRCLTYETSGWQWNFWIASDMTLLMHNFSDFTNRSVLSVLILTVVLSFISMFLLNRYLIRPVRDMARAATEFTPEEDGTYSMDRVSRVDVRTRDEIFDLNREIRSMQEKIVENTGNLAHMAAEKERIVTELNLAKNIQASALPSVFPPFPDRPEFDLYASMTPALDIGGDFYDFFLIDSDHLAMVVADVSGKGIPAALFMMVSMSLIQNQLMTGCDPATALERVNRQLCRRNPSMMFVTVWAAVLEIPTGRLFACNAGHENPAVRRAGGNYEILEYKHGLCLGVRSGSRYQVRVCDLSPGDSLFVHTDGVPEATDARNEMFGQERLAAALNTNPDANPEELIRQVRGAVDRFVNGAPQFDDLTMLALRYNGPGNQA